jgi:hypothetical protein
MWEVVLLRDPSAFRLVEHPAAFEQRSSTFRKLSRHFTYSSTARRITSGELFK